MTSSLWGIVEAVMPPSGDVEWRVEQINLELRGEVRDGSRDSQAYNTKWVTEVLGWDKISWKEQKQKRAMDKALKGSIIYRARKGEEAMKG